MRLCYISRCYNDAPGGAGIKAKSDVEDILATMGGVNLGLSRRYSKNKAKGFILNILGILKYAISLKKGDVVVLQYPVKKYYNTLCKLARFRGAKTISLIHDLGTFRRKKLEAQQEIEKLSLSDHLITLNSSMRQWLIDNGCNVPVSVQGIWDFLSGHQITVKDSDSPDKELPIAAIGCIRSVVYAGSLAEKKNPFLYQMIENVTNYKLDLFGNPGKRELAGENVVCHGYVDYNSLINAPTGDFALVWDGDSVDTCSGSFGEYLRYNTPHKVSLYVRMGLPIIIWKDAAMAKFITENKIGFCIDSINELNTIIPEITQDEYSQMKKNVKAISAKLAEGHFFRECVREIINS
ncbi:MAG: galactofuranosyltransferase [Bacteroidales bacterium]|nr:galactofuranosyltransferase [Bacteroidales bacterium]